MAKKIFIAATGQNCGKTTTSIGLMHLALKKYGRVGFIKPLGPKPATFRGCTVDKDAALIAQVFGLEKDLRWMSPVVVHPDTTRRVIGGFDYYPVLANPTLRRVSKLLGLPLQGNRREVSRIIHHVQIGAASTQRVTELICDPSLLIVTSSRDELLVTLANLYKIPSYRSRIVGLVIPGIAPVSNITQMILDRSNIPYMRAVESTTAELYRIITEDVSKITAADTEKLILIRSLAETYIDFELLDGIF